MSPTLCVVLSCSVISNSLQPASLSHHGILQARILEWVAMPSSRGSSQPRSRTQVSHIAGGFLHQGSPCSQHCIRHTYTDTILFICSSNLTEHLEFLFAKSSNSLPLCMWFMCDCTTELQEHACNPDLPIRAWAQ